MPAEFFDDTIYPLLEQPIPLLFADRLDYFLRDGLACGVVSSDFVERIVDCLSVVDSRIALSDLEVAREAAARFAIMNRDWWASPTEAFVYNEFADALREGLRLGILNRDDLMTDDMMSWPSLTPAEVGKLPASLPRSATFSRIRFGAMSPAFVPKNAGLTRPSSPMVRSSDSRCSRQEKTAAASRLRLASRSSFRCRMRT